MGKSHPMELRIRVVAFVEEGHGHREAATIAAPMIAARLVNIGFSF